MITCIECKKQPTVQLTGHSGYCHHTHYSISKLDDMSDLKSFFDDGKCNDLNWFVASMSGIHGSYRTLDEIEAGWDIKDEEDEKYCGKELTVSIILPRMVRIIYGVITVESKEDIAWLRSLVRSSLEQIAKTQQGNI